MAVTILDVAKEAKVSKSTVSLVINHSPNVKLETQYKVKQAIEKLGYTPNLAARELITSRTRTLGLIFITKNKKNRNYSFSSVCETLLYDTSNSIYSSLYDSEYALLVERFSIDNNPDTLPELVRNKRLDGIFLIGGLFDENFMEKLTATALPIVIIGCEYNGFDSVSVDNTAVGYIGMKYLIEKGHTSFIFINGPEENTNSIRKLGGIYKALDEASIDKSALLHVNSNYSGESAYHAMKNLWESLGPKKPTAVFGASDGITAGLLRYLYEQNLKVPDAVSVIGYEDSILSEYVSPALTVIDAHKEQIGHKACEVLLNRINKPRSKQVVLTLQPSLIERGSVKRI